MTGEVKLSADGSNRIKAVSFLCAMLVVPIHCWLPGTWMCEAPEISAWEAGIAFLFTDTISRCAVPCFFVISGFLLALKFQPTVGWYCGTLRKRFVSLYIPFVIWNMLYLIRDSVIDRANLFSLNGVLGYNLFVSPGFGLFWYVQVILLAVILSPIWLSLLRNCLTAAIVLLVCFAGWVTGNFGHWLSLQLSCGNLLWLSVGAAVAFHDCKSRAEKASSVKMRMAVAVILLMAIVVHVYAGVVRNRLLMNITDKVTIATGVYTLFLNSAIIHKWLSPFSSIFCLSFFIYAMHPQGLLVHIPLDAIKAPFLVAYFSRIVCGVVVPILVGCFLIRFAPKTIMLLTGGRVGK